MELIYQSVEPGIEECRDNMRDLLDVISMKDDGKNYVYELIKEFAIKNGELYINTNLVDLLNRIYKEERGPIFVNEYEKADNNYFG